MELIKIDAKSIPGNLIHEFGINPGAEFAAFGSKDTIVLKRIHSDLEDFEKLVNHGVEISKRRGIREEDVEDIVHKHRGVVK